MPFYSNAQVLCICIRLGNLNTVTQVVVDLHCKIIELEQLAYLYNIALVYMCYRTVKKFTNYVIIDSHLVGIFYKFSIYRISVGSK